MGRDWYWIGKSATNAAVRKNAIDREKDKEDVVRHAPGCMSGVLQLFDFHQFQFPINQPPCFKPSGLPQQDPTSIKGLNAPRNSLESDEGVRREALEVKEVDFDISVEIRKEAGYVKTRIDDQLSCSDSSNSPGPKTPSLVARLMGLDVLPDSASSSSSPASVRLNKVQVLRDGKQTQNVNMIKKQKMNFAENEMRFENTGSRSLPDTPRISSARRSDVDARHSLQIYREAVPSSGELDDFSRIPKDQKSRKRESRNEEENRSPGHYARQIVKQVKESVSRRVGSDITNTITTSTTTNARPKPKEVDVVILKSKKPKREAILNKHSSPPSSNPPRLRFSEERKHIKVRESLVAPPPSSSLNIITPTNTSQSRKPKLQQVPQQEKCKKASCERFTQRKEKPKPKIIQASSSSSTRSSSTSPSSSCNDDQGSKPGSRLSRCSSRITCGTAPLHDRVRQDDFADEIRYVSEILKCTGIHKDTLVSFTHWYSPSHPLDPCLFDYLENFDSPVPRRCNRKLIFDLTDELLVIFVKPYLNMKPWVDKIQFQREARGEQLLQHLCYEISKCPSSNCQTLEDIDNLVEKDIPSGRQPMPVFEEIELIAFEIERDLLDTLVHETAAEVVQLRGMCEMYVTWAIT